MDLLCLLVSFNTTVSFALRNIGNSLHVQVTRMNVHMEMQVNMVEIICTLMRNLSPNWSSSSTMAIGVSNKKKVLKCSPSHAIVVALKANISDLASKTSTFETLFTGSTSGSWLLYGKLVKMLLIDCEQNNRCYQMTISMLDFTKQLVEIGEKIQLQQLQRAFWQ